MKSHRKPPTYARGALFIFSIVALNGMATAAPPIGSPKPAIEKARLDPVLATQTFAQAQLLCEMDGGQTWGVSLCGPILIADPTTRRFIANMDGATSPLEQSGTSFSGVLPDTIGIGNTSVRWNGRSWTMLMAPLSIAEPNLSILLMHESWHRIQDQIGLAPVNADEDQLSTEDGRTSLRLELRALSVALTAQTSADQRRAIEDALAFRAWRQARFAAAQSAEDAMERHEGIAEYTGRILSRDPDMLSHLVDHLRNGDAVNEYARSFAYYTGPAYGILLDRFKPDWRAEWNRSDGLPQMLAEAMGISPSSVNYQLIANSTRYTAADIRRQEVARAIEHRDRLTAFYSKLVNGPVLAMPVSGAHFSFDPNRVTPFPPQGAVYGTIRAAGDWGVLDVEQDGLLSTDWSRLTVTYPGTSRTSDGWKGQGWLLTLQPGWELVPGARGGDWTIRHRP